MNETQLPCYVLNEAFNLTYLGYAAPFAYQEKRSSTVTVRIDATAVAFVWTKCCDAVDSQSYFILARVLFPATPGGGLSGAPRFTNSPQGKSKPSPPNRPPIRQSKIYLSSVCIAIFSSNFFNAVLDLEVIARICYRLLRFLTGTWAAQLSSTKILKVRQIFRQCSRWDIAKQMRGTETTPYFKSDLPHKELESIKNPFYIHFGHRLWC